MAKGALTVGWLVVAAGCRFDEPRSREGSGPADPTALSEEASSTVVGPAGSRIGTSIAIPGDLDGDGLDDLVYVDLDYRRADDAVQRGALRISYGRRELEALAVDGILEVEYQGGPIEFRVAAAGDVNADGHEDLLVGYPNTFGCTSSGVPTAPIGTAYLVLGGGRVDGLGSLSSHGRLAADVPCTFLGFAATGVGDVDGDGFADFAVSAPGDVDLPGVGRVYVFRGGVTPSLTATFSLRGQGQAHLGHFIEPAGDFDGDGHFDFLVSEVDAAQGLSMVHLVYGGPDLPTRETDITAMGFAVVGSVRHAYMAPLGDIDGDARDDIAIAGRGASGNLFYVVKGRAGRLTGVVDVSELAIARLTSSTLTGTRDIFRLGTTLAIGDIDALGGRGAVHLLEVDALLRPETSLDDAPRLLGDEGFIPPSQPYVDFAGFSVAMGDLNGDGKPEVAVGAPTNVDGLDELTGRIYVLSLEE